MTYSSWTHFYQSAWVKSCCDTSSTQILVAYKTTGLFFMHTTHPSWTGHIPAPHLPFQFSSVAQLCPTLCDPMTAVCQASISITDSQSLPKITSIELVIPSNHVILCHPLLLPPSIFPWIKVFSNESALRIRWPKYWSFSFNISPSNEHPGLISREMQIIIKWVNHYISTRVLKIKMSDPTYQGWMSGKQLEFSYTADGECKWYNHFGKESGRFLKS